MTHSETLKSSTKNWIAPRRIGQLLAVLIVLLAVIGILHLDKVLAWENELLVQHTGYWGIK